MRRVHPVGVADFEPHREAAGGQALAETVMLAMRQAAIGRTWIFEDGERQLLLAGIAEDKPGVGQLWMIRGAGLDGLGLGPMRTLRKLLLMALQGAVDGMGLRRLHSFVRADRPADRRWARWTGFVVEGQLARLASDGGDLIIMRWESAT